MLQPDMPPIGISVVMQADRLYLRMVIHDVHVAGFKPRDRIVLRGQPANGFIIAPDHKGNKLSLTASNRFRLMIAISRFEISAVPRRRIDMRPERENGHLRLPPLPPAWINADAEFRGGEFMEGTRVMHVSRTAGDEHIRESGTTIPTDGDAHALTVPTNGDALLHGTGPAPKPTLNYTVPDGLRDIQIALAAKLDEARALVRAMEAKTNMKFTLDRNMRVVVDLARST